MKKIFLLFAAALLLTGCSGGCSDDAAKDQPVSVMQEQTDSSVQEGASDNEAVTDNEEAQEQEAVILENEGDVEIIVPDGLESAGE